MNIYQTKTYQDWVKKVRDLVKQLQISEISQFDILIYRLKINHIGYFKVLDAIQQDPNLFGLSNF